MAAHWSGSRPGTHPVYYGLKGSTTGCRDVTYHRGFRSGELLRINDDKKLGMGRLLSGGEACNKNIFGLIVMGLV